MTDGPDFLDEQETEDARRLLAAAGGLTVAGLASGPAGLSFLVEPWCTPIWFTLAAVVMPTGESLALVRGFIRKKRPNA